MMAESPEQQGDPSEGYFEWQVNTLMLAYDLAEPIAADQADRVEARRERVKQEVGQMVREILPQVYLDDPQKDFPPELMMRITRVTLQRAARIAGV